jgi:hypothetical protein
VNESHAYPRPQLQRADWISLDGVWEFAIDHDGCADGGGSSVERHHPRAVRARDPGQRGSQHRLLPRLLLAIEGHPHAGQPLVLSEFGGIAVSANGRETWGYTRTATPQELAERYRRLLAVVTSLPLFAGFCYTQFADTYQEANGLLYADRTPKFPLAEMAAATAKAQSAYEEQVKRAWRERMMALQQEGHVALPDYGFK